MSLSEQIKSARKNAALTQQQLAELIGVAKSTIAGYEKGDREPDAVKLKLIAKHTGVTGSYLLELDDNYSRENYNGLNAEEARQFARGVSKAAMNVALMYDKLDEHGQEAVRAITEIEYSRMDLDIMSKGIDILDVIGAKRLGDVHGLPHYEAGDPNVANARYFSRNEQLEMAKDAAPDPVITDRSCIDQEMNPDHP